MGLPYIHTQKFSNILLIHFEIVGYIIKSRSESLCAKPSD
jgi:hypothetical protein